MLMRVFCKPHLKPLLKAWSWNTQGREIVMQKSITAKILSN